MKSVQLPPEPKQLKIFPLFTILGWILILLALIIGVFMLTPTAVDYFGNNAKATRDAAEVGSALLAQLVTLTSTPRWLVPLVFLGIASFMIGIAMAFSTIPALLKNRGEVMSACYPYIVETN